MIKSSHVYIQFVLVGVECGQFGYHWLLNYLNVTFNSGTNFGKFWLIQKNR